MVSGGELDQAFENLMVTGGGGGGPEGSGCGGAPAMGGWKDLAVDLLLRIVSLVDPSDRSVIVASGVCTGWRTALSFGVTQLSLSWCKNNISNLVESVAPKFTKLKVLTLPRQLMFQLGDDAVEAVANHCHDLKDLDLTGSVRLSDRSLYAIARGCSRLTKLNISGCSNFSDAALIYLSSYCKELKYLNLCSCERAATDKGLKAIASNCSQLQYLNLGWCGAVTDEGVISLAKGCPDLRDLDLCGCSEITDESVVALANGCPFLRTLDLYYCRRITDRAMYSLANSGMKSKQLLWNSRPAADAKNKDGLASLNISQCTALTPPAVQAVCDSFPGLHTCSGRHSLNMSGCLNLTSVHCACAVQAHRAGSNIFSNHAY